MKPYFEEKGIALYQADCLEAMRLIPDSSIDACITDPPYGTTACSWDSVIPFAPMWVELKRIVKKNGPIVLFGSKPFTSALVMSNPQMFKYEMVWEKTHAKGFFNADYQPQRAHENLLVFAAAASTYSPSGSMAFNPQMEEGEPYSRFFPSGTPVSNHHRFHASVKSDSINDGTRYPRSVIKVANPNYKSLHGTQKPVDLLRYLVRTYTNEGDTVLDFTCGSGTTGVACVIEKRNAVLIEQDAHYCEVSAARIKRAQGVACDIPKRVKQYAPTPLFEAVA